MICFIALPQDNIVQTIQITLNIIENFDSLNIFCSDPDDSLQNMDITLISYLNLWKVFDTMNIQNRGKNGSQMGQNFVQKKSDFPLNLKKYT